VDQAHIGLGQGRQAAIKSQDEAARMPTWKCLSMPALCPPAWAIPLSQHRGRGWARNVCPDALLEPGKPRRRGGRATAGASQVDAPLDLLERVPTRAQIGDHRRGKKRDVARKIAPPFSSMGLMALLHSEPVDALTVTGVVAPRRRASAALQHAEPHGAEIRSTLPPAGGHWPSPCGPLNSSLPVCKGDSMAASESEGLTH